MVENKTGKIEDGKKVRIKSLGYFWSIIAADLYFLKGFCKICLRKCSDRYVASYLYCNCNGELNDERSYNDRFRM